MSAVDEAEPVPVPEIMRFFTYNHLAEWEQKVVGPFCDLAWSFWEDSDEDCAQVHECLQRLLDAMTAAKRAFVLEVARQSDEGEIVILDETDDVVEDAPIH